MKTGEQEHGVAVFVDRSQFPEAVRAELIRSFKAREINHKFHYESYKQAQKWLALHEAYSPARKDRDCLAMYDAAFSAVAGKLGGETIRVIGLGCGGGQKDVRLLDLLRAAKARLAYVACDVSLPLVLTARAAALHVLPGEAIEPMVCDLAQAGNLGELLAAQKGGRLEVCDTADQRVGLRGVRRSTRGERRLVTFFGMVPNFEPDEIFPRLTSAVRRGDWLLISANLVPNNSEAAMRRILPQYDNELTRDWLMTLLYDAGVEERDGRLGFSIEQTERAIPLLRFVARFRFARNREVRLGDVTVGFKRGDVLRLFFSYRYTVESLAQELRQCGFAVAQKWVARSEQEGVFVARR